jgi:hypothetical protein
MADIKVIGKLLTTPRQLGSIYRLHSPKVNEKTVRALAHQLGMSGQGRVRLTSDENKLTYSDGPLQLTMYRASGGIRFIDRARWQIDDGRSDLRVEDAMARRLAQNYLKTHNLAPAGQLKLYKIARLRVGEATKAGGQSSERTIDVAAAVQRLVDKIPVDGPGGKAVVYFDHENRVTGFEMIWRQTGGLHRRGDSYRTPQSAIDEMAAHFRSKQGVIEVQQMHFGYFEEGWRAKQLYLQPAYVIFGMLTFPGSHIRKRTIYVATALTNAVGRITPVLRQRPPQPPRPSN